MKRITHTHVSPPTDRRRPARSTSGFTIVEVLIVLAILAALTTAIGFAIDASLKSFAVNVGHAEAVERARSASLRITADLRTATDVTPLNAGAIESFRKGNSVVDQGVSFIDAAGRSVTYRFDADAKLLLADVDDLDPLVLARGVEAFSIRLTPARSADARKAGLPHDLLDRGTLSITVRPTGGYGDRTDTSVAVTLSASIAPRTNRW
jgi:prepilin-type N-terminal cleavage/methylation domain-containing protein